MSIATEPTYIVSIDDSGKQPDSEPEQSPFGTRTTGSPKFKKSFWKKRLSAPRCIFGGRSGSDIFAPNGNKEHGSLKDILESWTTVDKFGFIQGRLSILKAANGSSTDSSPSPFAYRPNDLNPDISGCMLRKAPSALVMNTRYEKRDTMAANGILSYDIRTHIGNPNYIGYPDIKESPPVPGFDVRHGVVPGVGSYGFMDIDKTSKFMADPTPKLRPMTTSPSSSRRSKLNFNRIAFDDFVTPGPGAFDPVTEADNIASPSKGRTILEKIPLMGVRETLPGSLIDIDTTKAFPFAGSSVLSHAPNLSLRKDPLRSNINVSISTPQLLSFSDKKLYKSGYVSDYSFPKKVENTRGKKGRVFNSTVQNMPQFHQGKHAQGAYIKT